MPFVRPAAPLVDVLELHALPTNVNRCRLSGFAAALLLAAVGLTGCGSSDNSDEASQTAAWVNGLCGALTTWKGSIQSVGSSLKDVNQLSKATIEQAASDVSAANDKLSGDLQALGAPPKTGGDEAKAAIDDLSNELKASADDVKSATKDISSATDAVAAVNVASGALLAMSNDISSTLSTLESLDAADEWKSAFTDSEACKSLKS
jgi:methyl-accepting chemotaxis protein